MLAYEMGKKDEIASRVEADIADAKMVSTMRLILAVSMLLTLFVDATDFDGINTITLCIFSGYALYSLVFFSLSLAAKQLPQRKEIHWIDLVWCTLIVLYTGGTSSLFFLFFFFTILTTAFRWGFDDGAHITIAAAAMFAATGLMSEPHLARMILRTAFLLAFGYMCAYWGESSLRTRRKLAFVREVSRLSNPRFGVDHTITSVLAKTLAFFGGTTCILVMRESESGICTLRTLHASGDKKSILAQEISADVAAPLLALSDAQIYVFNRAVWPFFSLLGGALSSNPLQNQWLKSDQRACEHLAELMEAQTFISVPMSLKKGEGRLYVVSSKGSFKKTDTLFLNHIAAQAFPVIDSIELLDTMASEAASHERQKIALDLHDSAIQPYVGLKIAVGAVRSKAQFDNPLLCDLDKLTCMTDQVLRDLRVYAGKVKDGPSQTEPVFLVDLHRQTAHIKKFYDIDIVVSIDGDLKVSDRLKAEMLQIVREGLSNICKHTVAHRGYVKLQCFDEWIKIQIENDGFGTPQIDFVPRSITGRAAALGGRAYVRQGLNASTAVHIEIPI